MGACLLLSLLGRDEEALDEGRRLLEDSRDRFKRLLVVAQVYQRQYRWHDAARCRKEALNLASTRAREAMARHQIGRRPFDEARYRDAAAEFEGACDLYRLPGGTTWPRCADRPCSVPGRFTVPYPLDKGMPLLTHPRCRRTRARATTAGPRKS